MYLLIEVAGYIDTLPTIGLVMLTAVVGVALLKRQGMATLTRGVGRLNRGEVPAREMAEGILLAVAGALLVTPGFITDGVGFVLLFPPTRMLIASRLLRNVQVQGVSLNAGSRGDSAPPESPFGPGRPGPDRNNAGPGPQRPPGDAPVTLEGDYERKS